MIVETPLTLALATAISEAVGQRSMRRAGRTKWIRRDFQAAAATFDRLATHAVDAPAPLRNALKIAARQARRST